MAYFTSEFRDVLRRFGDKWMKDGWPIFDESYREELVDKIKENFYFREIGLETEEMFIQRYRIKMRLCMQRHNAMYLSMGDHFDPLASFVMRKRGKDVTRGDIENLTAYVTESKGNLDQAINRIVDETDINTRVGNRNGKSTNNGRNVSKARSINSDFPQTLLAGNQDYATTGGDTVGEGTTEGKSVELVVENSDSKNIAKANNQDNTQSQTESSDKHDGNQTTRSEIQYILGGITEGRSMDVGSILKSWLEVAQTADEMVMNDLDSLFMGLYSTGDNFNGPYEHRLPGYYYF